MSTEQTTSGPTSSASSVYPSTSIPPTNLDEPMLTTNNGSQAENGTYLTSDSTRSVASNPSSYYSKIPTSNGQYSANSNHNNSSPAPESQPSNSTTPQPILNNDHSSDSTFSQPPTTTANDTNSTNEQPSTINTETTPPNAFKAQITTTSLKPKTFNGGDKTPTSQTQIVDQVEPSTSVPTGPKTTPKASQPRNRTPARSRQKAANGGGEPRPRPNNTTANNSSQPNQGTKRPHPQFAYHPPPPSKDSRVASYARFNSNVSVPASSQVHPQPVQYSIPGSNYNSPKIYVQSQGPSSVPNSATYTVHQRPGTSTLAQRSSVPSGASNQSQVIIHCRPDQQTYSQSQTSNQHFIIQTQQASDQSPNVYQQRTGVNVRPELQRQYIQTIQNGPPQSSVANASGQQAAGQPQVVHIQLHHGNISDQQQKLQILQQAPLTSAVQQQLMEKRLNQIPNGPQQQSVGSDQQVQGPSSSASTIVHQHHVPSTAQQQQIQRTKAIRTLPPQPQMAIKQEEVFEDVNMHPAQVSLPDSFSTILDQIHSSGESPKAFYRKLKKQFKYLVYENECYQEELRNSQRHLLKLSRDKNFLLDRLLNYESLEEASEESDDADSDATIEEKIKPKKKKAQPATRKRNPPSTSKKAANKSIPKPEDENSQGSVDSGILANSQGAVDSFSQFSSAPATTTSSTTHDNVK